MSFIHMYDGFEATKIDQALNFCTKSIQVKKKLLKQITMKVSVQDHEYQKEQNLELVIDMYGLKNMLFDKFEDMFYHEKI